MTIADLEHAAARAAEKLAKAEAEADAARGRLDAALARSERAPRTPEPLDDLSWTLRVAELRAAILRKRAHAAREALELVRVATAGRSRRSA